MLFEDVWEIVKQYMDEEKMEIIDSNHDRKSMVKKYNGCPDKLVYNGDYTLMFYDGDCEQVVKLHRHPDDESDPVYAFLYGYFLRNTGMSKAESVKFLEELNGGSID